MTEPVWVPARRRSPGHTLRLDAAASAALFLRGCRLRTPSSDVSVSFDSPPPSPGAQMSPSGRLCLLTIIGLILPTRGQVSEEATSISPADLITVTIHALIQTPGEERTTDTVHPELQSMPETSTLKAGGEATSMQTETQMQQMVETPDPEAHKTTREEWRSECQVDSNEDNPFFYDEFTLRKQGLLVAAVLFITGIVILTSGKCRQLPRLCRNSNGTYRIVTEAQSEREDTNGTRVGVDSLSPLP
ncbi:FXYD domain-containing ion transport regulator 5 [Rhynchonycteris naso]